MKITYFQDTDTLYLEFNNNPIVETQEINENGWNENELCVAIDHIWK